MRVGENLGNTSAVAHSSTNFGYLGARLASVKDSSMLSTATGPLRLIRKYAVQGATIACRWGRLPHDVPFPLNFGGLVGG